MKIGKTTAKGIKQIAASRLDIQPGHQSTLRFLDTKTTFSINAAPTIRQCSFEPVPIISAQWLHAQHNLDHLLYGLIAEATPSRFILVGGDPAEPAGPSEIL